ncbi:MAG: multiheme c-type cytochrome [Deferrisomatales bacterium]
MGRALALGAGAALLLALAGTGWAADDPHGFLSQPGQCTRCHVEAPKPGTPRAPLRFRKDVVSLCLECHGDKDLSALHPVDIRPGFRVPRGLPLDEQGAITCATCHDPHGPASAPVAYVAESLSGRLLSLLTRKRQYRTFYLRRPNDRGQLCLGCHDRNLMAVDGFHVREESRLGQYAGSEACRACHPEAYREWKRTPHARMVRDLRRDPAAAGAAFDGTPPFPRESARYALGSHWTMRFVAEKDGKLVVKAPIWSVTQKAWDTSYWIDKPWAQNCQGCHTTGFELKGEPRFAELGVGCEACHGPGRAHAESGGRAPVVNPAALDPVRRAMVCQSCHTTGHDRSGQFRFPLGYLPGKDLTTYFRGLMPKPGQDNDTFVGDESYDDRNRQWLFWTRAFWNGRGLDCDVCKNFRGGGAAGGGAPLSPAEFCLSCHRDTWPRTELHTGHLAKKVQCHRCHVPRLDRSGKRYSIHDHKFLFLDPEAPRNLTPREACAQCHRGVASSRRP